MPHHGSSDPGLPAVLERLRPEFAAIEVGDNTYGHPAPSTLRAPRPRGGADLPHRPPRDGRVGGRRPRDCAWRPSHDRRSAGASRAPPTGDVDWPRGRSQARLPRLRRRRRQDRRVACPRAQAGRGRARPGRPRDLRCPAERPRGDRGRDVRSELRGRDALPPGRRRRRLEGRSAGASGGSSRGAPARDRARAHRARQGAEAALEGGREGRGRGAGVRRTEALEAARMVRRAGARAGPAARQGGGQGAREPGGLQSAAPVARAGEAGHRRPSARRP